MDVLSVVLQAEKQHGHKDIKDAMKADEDTFRWVTLEQLKHVQCHETNRNSAKSASYIVMTGEEGPWNSVILR